MSQKIKFVKIMEFVGIFRKNNIQAAYLPKTSIVGQIISKDLYEVIRA